MAHTNINKAQKDLQILVLETSLLNFIAELRNVILTVILVQRNNTILLSMLNKNESFWIRKLRKNAEKRSMRLPRSLWFKKGRTEQWWENLLTGELPEEEWKKKMRMSRSQFIIL